VEEQEELIGEQPALFIPTSSPALLIEKSDFHDFLAEMGNKYLKPGRGGNNLNWFTSCLLKLTQAKARICPRLSYVCRSFGTSDGVAGVHSNVLARALIEKSDFYDFLAEMGNRLYFTEGVYPVVLQE